MPKNLGIDIKIKSLVSPQAKLENYPLKGFWTSYSPPTLFFPSSLFSESWKCSHLIPIPKNMGIDTKIKSLASPQAKLENYTLKGFWTSYSPSTLFLTFRLI